MEAGNKVRLKSDPSRIGILTGERKTRGGRVRLQVTFLVDGTDQFVLQDALEPVTEDNSNPYTLFRDGRYGRVGDLRGALTYYRLSGKLANLIYSMNTTNTEFYAYQFKPVLSFLESPSRGILIADEVGLGKTIEAGLIWTELRSRFDARRLLVLCPAVLREKWQFELSTRFGINAEICAASDVLQTLRRNKTGELDAFALIGSLQGLRPPRNWEDEEESADVVTAQLARLMSESEHDDPLFDLVIIDEAHYLRNPETQTAKLGKLVRSVADSLVLLSATPIQLSSSDLFNLVKLLDEDNFAQELFFDNALYASEPLIKLRDEILAGVADLDSFLQQLRATARYPALQESQQIQHYLTTPPTEKDLEDYDKRSELADLIDRINPLSRVVTRTRKRDVHERKVVREPQAIGVSMTEVEENFYHAVTDRVRKYCERYEISEGFLLTIPQRQMTSSMAAACRAWNNRLNEKEDEEFLYEALDVNGETTYRRPKSGPLLQELVHIAHAIGDYEVLRACDSKYHMLLGRLRRYWTQYPDKKIVLFSFYRETLNYLSERLSEDGVSSVLLMGGMDKQEAINRFETTTEARLLLASEVASEGVDLQFSSLLINYDLPWNPMKIEQRIGRIDRIGQQEKLIHIWNVFHQGTIDERIYVRLFERLEIFQRALGSMEAILGEDIRKMSYELFSHDLSKEQEEQVLEQTYMAIANRKFQEERLEEQASHLIAHGDYIQNKVKAAQELKRFITADDLYHYFKEFFEQDYPGTRITRIADDKMLFEIELTPPAKIIFGDFLQRERLLGRTKLVQTDGNVRAQYLFDNKVVVARNGHEVISQYHPVIRFIEERHRTKGIRTYHPVTASVVASEEVVPISSGTYVFSVERWSMRVATRDIERLAYCAVNVETGGHLDTNSAERLVNTSAMLGQEWLAVSNAVDGNLTEERFGECGDALHEEYQLFVDGMKRENADRISLQLHNLDSYLARETGVLRDLIARLIEARKFRGVKLNEDKLKKLHQRVTERKSYVQMSERPTHENVLVSSGIILVR